MSNNGVVVAELTVPARMSWESWCLKVRSVGWFTEKKPWIIGDLVLYGEHNFHEKASQMLNEFGCTERQISAYRWVASKFPPEDRCDLPWTWHQSAAALPKRERDKALTAALAGELNRAGIRALANGGNGNGTHVPPPDEPTPLIDALLLVGVESRKGRMLTSCWPLP